MPSCLIRFITTFTTEVMIAGTRYVVKTQNRHRKDCEADEAFAQAEHEVQAAAAPAAQCERRSQPATAREHATQAKYDQTSGNQQSGFDWGNERWGADLRAYEEVMKQQDEEIEMLEELRGYRQCEISE
jgi:hypothetical protein